MRRHAVSCDRCVSRQDHLNLTVTARCRSYSRLFTDHVTDLCTHCRSRSHGSERSRALLVRPVPSRAALASRARLSLALSRAPLARRCALRLAVCDRTRYTRKRRCAAGARWRPAKPEATPTSPWTRSRSRASAARSSSGASTCRCTRVGGHLPVHMHTLHTHVSGQCMRRTATRAQWWRLGRVRTDAQNCCSAGVANLSVIPSYLSRLAGGTAHTACAHRMHQHAHSSYGGAAAAARVLTRVSRGDCS